MNSISESVDYSSEVSDETTLESISSDSESETTYESSSEEDRSSSKSKRLTIKTTQNKLTSNKKNSPSVSLEVTRDDTGDGTDLSDIIISKINDKYSEGIYLDMIVVLETKTSYINVTKMCRDIGKETGSTKKINDWKRLASAKELIVHVSETENIPINKLTKIINGGSNTKISGCYIHPLLVPSIASWVDVCFGLKVMRIVNEFANKNALDKKDKLIKTKDNKINTLTKKVDKILKDTAELKKINKSQSGKLKKMRDDTKHIRNNTDILRNELDAKCFNVVVKTQKTKDDNILLIFKKNDQPVPIKSKKNTDQIIEPYFDYYVARTTKQNRKSTIERLQRIYENMNIVMEIKYVPNAIVLWKTITEELAVGRNKKITVNGNGFNLVDGYTQIKLVKDIKRIFNRRLDHADVDD